MNNRYFKNLIEEYDHVKFGKRIYMCLYNMLERCYNPDSSHYKWYGEKGIVVCDEWRMDVDRIRFKTFYYWAINNGYSKNLTIDRINTGGEYSPNNCRWVLMDVQNKNRSSTTFYTYKGITKCLKDWSLDSLCKTNYKILHKRIVDLGWSFERALLTPNRKCERLEHFTLYNETKSLFEWAKDYRSCVDYKVLFARVKIGWNLEKALTTEINFDDPKYTLFGETKRLCEWKKDNRLLIPPTTLEDRIRRGWKFKDAFILPKRSKKPK